ncbi:MAG: radical SAM protein [Promethearchaeati archaeon SRVP18_Atabeyarchaeia-1]
MSKSSSLPLRLKELVRITVISVVRAPVDIRLLYPPIGMAYVTSYLKSRGHSVKQMDLAAEMRLDLRSRLALAECSRTSRVLLKIIFRERYPVSAEEVHRDLMTPEVRHVSILPSDYSIEDAASTIQHISDLVKDCSNRIMRTKADAIGFHVTWDSTLLSLLVAKNLKDRDKDLRIVFGGPDCSRLFRGKLISHLGYVDAVVTGEGEKTTGDLLDAWDKGHSAPKRMKGCLTNIDGRVVDNGEPDLASNLDALPFPDYSDLPLRSYTAFYALPLLTSRGCRYNCTFCVDRLAVWNGTYRERSIDNVVKEIVQLHQRYEVRTLYFCDSSLNPTLQRLTGLCDGIAEAERITGDEILWGGDIRASPLTRAALQKMHDVGCRYLMFGAESASPQILRSMGKGVTAERMAEVFKWAREAGIWVFTYWIVGYPGEKGDDLMESMKFLVENSENIDEACVAPCEVGYGSELYRRRGEFKVKFLKSAINLRKELMVLEKHSRGYKVWVDQSGTNTPIDRLYRRTIFEALARSLGYPSNWAVWPPMPPIGKLNPNDVPVADEYIVHRIEGKMSEEEIYIESKSTMESMKASLQQLQILELCDGTRSIGEISGVIHGRGKTKMSLNETIEDSSRILGEMVRREIIRLRT